MPEYSDPHYWVERYKKEPNTNFDWYLTFVNLKDILEPYLRDDAKILVVGCGNSRLSYQLYEAGYQSIVSIDIAENVVEQMVEKYKESAPELEWQKMDVRKLDFPSETFDLIVDKGTMDALLCGKDSFENVLCAHKEINRCLKPQGIYVNITYGQPESRLDHFKRQDLNWNVETKTVPKSMLGLEENQDNPSNYFYVYICSHPQESPKEEQEPVTESIE
ncbi:hypothetical protein GEMRC1_006754 [Eukaryota sp. GEM-RC1]